MKYLIRKQGAWYRPNSQGYTGSAIQAGRYKQEEAVDITHPNGPDGPRDGMSYIHEDDVVCGDWAAYTEQAAEIERLTAFIEELRDYKPEIHSGRQHDPQDDVPDVIEAETFLLFQEDATTLLNKEPTS